MALLTALQYVTNALFVGLAGLCFLEWRRRRGAATAWLVVTFGALTVVVIAGAVREAAGTTAENAPGWVVKPLVAALFIFPYLLFRFTAALDRAARRTEVLAGLLAGAVVVWTLLLPRLPAEGEPRPAGFAPTWLGWWSSGRPSR